MRRNYYVFLVVKLKLSLQKFYCRNPDLDNRYAMFVSHVTTYVFPLS